MEDKECSRWPSSRAPPLWPPLVCNQFHWYQPAHMMGVVPLNLERREWYAAIQVEMKHNHLRIYVYPYRYIGSPCVIPDGYASWPTFLALPFPRTGKIPRKCFHLANKVFPAQQLAGGRSSLGRRELMAYLHLSMLRECGNSTLARGFTFPAPECTDTDPCPTSLSTRASTAVTTITIPHEGRYLHELKTCRDG